MKNVLFSGVALIVSILAEQTAAVATDFCNEDLTLPRIVHCSFDVRHEEQMNGQCITPPSLTIQRIEVFKRGNARKQYGSALRIIFPPYYGSTGEGGCYDTVRQHIFCEPQDGLRIRDIGRHVRRIYSQGSSSPMIVISHRNRRVSAARYIYGSSPARVILGTCTKK